MAQHVFRATVWEHSPEEPGSWHFLTVPLDVSEDIALEAGPRGGFGSVRVEVTIGSTTWRVVVPRRRLGQLRASREEAGTSGRGLARRVDL